MLENEMKINQLEEENMELKNKIKLLEERLNAYTAIIHNTNTTSDKDQYEDKVRQAEEMEKGYIEWGTINLELANERYVDSYEQQVTCLG